MIIALQNQKGGVGKTTLSVHIAHAFALQNRRVLLVDADPQGSCRDWAAAREGKPLFPVIAIDRPVIHKELPQMAGDYDDIVIDGPPRVSGISRSAILAADLVVMPVTPSPYDVWATKETVDLLEEAMTFKPGIKAVFVINRKIFNTAIGRDVVEALAGYPFPALEHCISQRVIFAESANSGTTVLELEINGQAAQEIFALADELRKVVGA